MSVISYSEDRSKARRSGPFIPGRLLIPLVLTVLAVISTIAAWHIYSYVRYRSLVQEYYAIAPDGVGTLRALYQVNKELDFMHASEAARQANQLGQWVYKPAANVQAYMPQISRAEEIRRQIVLLGFAPPPE